MVLLNGVAVPVFVGVVGHLTLSGGAHSTRRQGLLPRTIHNITKFIRYYRQ